MRLLVASNNAHKHQELREILAALGAPFDLTVPRAIGILIDPDETASTYQGNAALKARAFAAALRGLPRGSGGGPREARSTYVIADDSGLEVDALLGAPGIYSARYHRRAPEGDGCAELLRELRAVPDELRTARFQCAIVVVGHDRSEHTFLGTCEGRIGYEKRGAGGFGFDPVFIVDAGGRTMAELPTEEKHRVSHRGIATRKAVAYLLQQNPPNALQAGGV